MTPHPVPENISCFRQRGLTYRRKRSRLIPERNNAVKNIHIVWKTDEHDCDDCGQSFADGAKVRIDGIGDLDLSPHAYCFDGDSYSKRDVCIAIAQKIGRIPIGCDAEQFREFFERLGYEITEEDGD